MRLSASTKRLLKLSNKRLKNSIKRLKLHAKKSKIAISEHKISRKKLKTFSLSVWIENLRLQKILKLIQKISTHFKKFKNLKTKYITPNR